MNLKRADGSEYSGLKYEQPSGDDRKHDQPKVVHFKLSFTSFHRFSPSQGAFLSSYYAILTRIPYHFCEKNVQIALIFVTLRRPADRTPCGAVRVYRVKGEITGEFSEIDWKKGMSERGPLQFSLEAVVDDLSVVFL